MPKEFLHPLLAAGFIIEAAIRPPPRPDDYTEACRVLLAAGLPDRELGDLQETAYDAALANHQITRLRIGRAIGEGWITEARQARLERDALEAEAKLGEVWKRIAERFPVPQD